MYELPLFPLKTILFPEMPVRLHIFEERYKTLIRECYAHDKPFGIVLINKGQEIGGRATPYTVGCTALITELEPLSGGRMNIVAVGQTRFKIHSLQAPKPYLSALVEDIPLAHLDSVEAERTWVRTMRPWVRRYLQLLAAASNTPFDLGELPSDALRLANLSAYLLQLENDQKQELLEYQDTSALLPALTKLYRREVTILQAMFNAREQPMMGTFSLN